MRDVSTQYEPELRHKATFGVNPTAMNILRIEDLQFTEVNDSFLRLTSYECDEVVSRTADQLGLQLEQEKRELAIQRLRRKDEDSIVEHEAVLRTKSGEYRTVLSEGRVIRFDHTLYLIDTYVNISERKRSENELAQAIKAAMQDPSWFVRWCRTSCSRFVRGQAPKPGLELLSPRELEVLTAIAKGLNNEQIASKTGLAPQTMRSYISNIYDKIGVHSRGLKPSSGLENAVLSSLADCISRPECAFTFNPYECLTTQMVR